MSWDKDKTEGRIQEEIEKGFSPTVTNHGREIDFSNLGAEDVRRVQGVHVYADIPNFNKAVAEAGDDKQKQRKLLRQASVLRKVQVELLEPDGIELLQFQATRLHFLVFRPYDDEAARVQQAVASAITLQSYLYEVFNEVFEGAHEYVGAIGIASGETLIANVGHRGDRELISLGSAANLSAKAIGQQGTITITEDAYRLLPDCLKTLFAQGGSVCDIQTYLAHGLSWNDHDDLKEELDVKFEKERLKRLTEEYRDALSLNEMEITGADAPIDIESLTEKNSKRIHAIPIYADLSGFTKRIQNAEKDEEVEAEVRNLHIIRQEFHRVIEQDFPGAVIQHQGDCVIAIIHVPTAEDKRSQRCLKGAYIAIGLQSSMDQIVRQLDLGDSIHVAVGLAEGNVLVTRIGKKGSRVVLCLGPSVGNAQALQEMSSGKEIRISAGLYEGINDEEVRAKFFKTCNGNYLAKGLTFDSLAKAKDRSAAIDG